MSERGVCICPACGCQFSDWRKTELEARDRKRRAAPERRFGIKAVLARAFGRSW